MMAVFSRGMNAEEVTALTQAMLQSGEEIDLSSVGKITVDKHSTGGVGDKVSLILAPLVASLGVPVPMMSGRGLGHTGGTLDKLEFIPGLRTDLTEVEYIRLVKEIGVAMIGQTKSLAPADKKMYALRDVTATVESIPLIAGSIMSKKLAAGPQALVFDVKTGLGAFMKTMEMAEEMARTLVQIAVRSGRRAAALITDMNQPLGFCAGNALEIKETVASLKGAGPEDLMTVTLELAGWMLYFGEKAESPPEGKTMAGGAIRDGLALAKFKEMVARQRGDTAYIDDPTLFPPASLQIPLPAARSGYIHSIDAFEMGMVCVTLGAGRETADAEVDPSAGIVFTHKVSDAVKEGELLLTLHTNRKEVVEEVKARCLKAITIQDSTCEPRPIIYKIVEKDSVREYT